MKGVSETLAGRVGIMNLLGLSNYEIQGHGSRSTPFSVDPKSIDRKMTLTQPMGLKEVYHRIWRGSFPRLYLNPETDWELFYGSYLQTYVQRDVAHLTQVGDQNTFLRFLTAIAARIGQLLNLAEVSRTVGISNDTAKRWLSILEASNIVYPLQPYFTNITKRAIKSPKIYFLDTGLAAWSNSSTLEAGAFSGHIFENTVVLEILKSFWHQGKRAPIYFYRNKDGNEIDILMVKDGKYCPIEVKKTGNPSQDDIRHFKCLQSLGLPIGRGAIIGIFEAHIPINENVEAIPMWTI